MKKLDSILICLLCTQICLSQINICFKKERDTISRSSLQDISIPIKISLDIPKDSVLKVSLTDTKAGTMPLIEYQIATGSASFTADTNSLKSQEFSILLKKDTIGTPDRNRTIILVLSINNNRINNNNPLTNQCTQDTLILVIKPFKANSAPVDLPEAGNAARLCIKKRTIEYMERTTFFNKIKNRYSKDYTVKGKIFVDSVTLKFEDKGLSEIQVFARGEEGDQSTEYLFENRFSIPLKGPKNHANLSTFKLYDYRNPVYISRHPIVMKNKFILLGELLSVVPVLENYTFDYSPADTVIGIGKNKCIDPKDLPRSSIISMIQLRIMNDLLGALGDKANGVMQAQLRINLNTNFLNVGSWTFFHATEIFAGYSQYSESNRFLRLNFEKGAPSGLRYVNLLQLVQRPTFFIAFRENLIKKEFRPSSTKWNIYGVGGIGYTRVKDTIIQNQGTTNETKVTENRQIKFSMIGLEGRIKFLMMKGFFAEIGSQFLMPFVLTRGVREDISQVDDEDEIISTEPYKPEVPEKNRQRWIFSPYLNLTIYPNKHSYSSSLHVRGQWFKSLTNNGSFLQVQFGANIELKTVLGKLF